MQDTQKVYYNNGRTLTAIFLGSLTSKLADSLCVDYPAQVTTRRLSMTVAVAVAIEEASK